MKLNVIILSLFAFSLYSCGGDDDLEMHYDGSNFSAPLLIAGTQEVAARFTSFVVSENAGRKISGVSFYLQDLPNACTVKIYDRGTDISPGALIYSAEVTSSLRSNSWNNHTISSPILLEDQEIWLALELVHNSDLATIGCDSGPADSNGDFLLDILENEWSTFRVLSNGETSINWNLRAVLSEE